MADLLFSDIPAYVTDKHGALFNADNRRVGFAAVAGGLLDLYNNAGTLQQAGVPISGGGGGGGWSPNNPEQFPVQAL